MLAKGSNNDGVNIELVAEQTPVRRSWRISRQKKQLGGMKVTNGTKLEKDASRSWQVFRKDGETQFILELVDYSDKSFTSTYYAYKDGKPWAIVQEAKPSRDGKTIYTDRAAWDEDGQLVVKQHQVGSDVQELDADAVDSLKKQAKSSTSWPAPPRKNKPSRRAKKKPPVDRRLFFGPLPGIRT